MFERINILVNLVNLLGLIQCSADMYIEQTNKVNFSTARSFCEGRGQSLLVAPSYDQYSRFEELAAENSLPKNDYWIGVIKYSGTEEYQWLNGQNLSVYWKGDEPKNPKDKQCVMVEKEDSRQWKTSECDKDFYYICVDYTTSVTDYYIYRTAVVYSTARSNCQAIGRDLAMIKTKQQQTALKTFLQSENVDKEVWIGLEGFGLDDKDYRKFRWIDGDYMHTMDSNNIGLLDVKSEDKCILYHPDRWGKETCDKDKLFICTGPMTYPVPDTLTNYYDLIENKKPIVQPLQQTTTLSNTKCAGKCSKSYHCYMYAYDGSNCELFQKSTLFVPEDVPDRKLYLRRVIN